MHTVDCLDHALRIAGEFGYKVRQECLDGSGGGSCEIKGKKWIFLDLASPPADQLDVVIDALAHDNAIGIQRLPQELRRRVRVRKAA